MPDYNPRASSEHLPHRIIQQPLLTAVVHFVNEQGWGKQDLAIALFERLPRERKRQGFEEFYQRHHQTIARIIKLDIRRLNIPIFFYALEQLANDKGLVTDKIGGMDQILGKV